MAGFDEVNSSAYAFTHAAEALGWVLRAMHLSSDLSTEPLSDAMRSW